MRLLEENRVEITAWMERAEKLMDESELQGADEHQFMVCLSQACYQHFGPFDQEVVAASFY